MTPHGFSTLDEYRKYIRMCEGSMAEHTNVLNTSSFTISNTLSYPDDLDVQIYTGNRDHTYSRPMFELINMFTDEEVCECIKCDPESYYTRSYLDEHGFVSGEEGYWNDVNLNREAMIDLFFDQGAYYSSFGNPIPREAPDFTLSERCAHP